MKSCFYALSALLAVPAAAAPPPAAPATAAVTEWYEDISIRRQTNEFTEDVSKLSNGGFGFLRWDDWINPADLPASLKRREIKLYNFLAADADHTGRVTGCRVLKPSASKEFDALACKALVDKGQFDPLYLAPGKPVARTLNISVWWISLPKDKVAPMSPAMAMPRIDSDAHTLWPRRQWGAGLRVEAFPNLTSLIPQGVKAKGKTSLDVTVNAASGVSTCTLGVSAGDARLDKAACDAAVALPMAYATPCDGCGDRTIPLQFVWNDKASHIRVPLKANEVVSLQIQRPEKGADPLLIPHDPADPRKALYYQDSVAVTGFYAKDKDFKDVADRSVGRLRVMLQLAGTAIGTVTGCEIVYGSGNQAIDDRLCALAKKRSSLTRVQDVFGDLIPGSARLSLKLDEVATLRVVPR
jgi:hypothetical protein